MLTALSRLSFELDPTLDVQSPLLAQALAIWQDARGPREFPARSDFDPVALPAALLPHILLVDIEHEPRRRFRWRLIGTHITEVMGRDSTGRYWDEIYEPAMLDAIGTGPRWVLEHRGPIRSLGMAPLPGRAHLRSENLDLPLSSDGQCIDMLLVVSIYG